MAAPLRKQIFKKQLPLALPFTKGKQQSGFCFSKGDVQLEYVLRKGPMVVQALNPMQISWYLAHFSLWSNLTLIFFRTQMCFWLGQSCSWWLELRAYVMCSILWVSSESESIF